MSTDITKTTPQDEATRLLGYLQQFRTDRGALAPLRCGLRHAQQSRAWPLLARFGGVPHGDADHKAAVVVTVAGLWATEPDTHAPGDFGGEG